MLSFKSLMILRGVDRSLNNLKRVERSTHTAMVTGFQKCLLLVEREAVKLVSFGALRAVDTGAMRSTISSGITNTTIHTIEGIVYVGKHYSILVHQGLGPHSGNPRPFMRRALKNKANRCMQIMRSDMSASMRKVERTRKP